MNNKISIHTLAEELANRSGKDASTCEKFIKELFGAVAKGLEENESVHINGLGIFSRSVSETDPVTFVPDTTFADTLNAPFAMFQPEELNDEVTAELLETVGNEEEHNEAAPVPETIVVAETVEEEPMEEEGTVEKEEPEMAEEETTETEPVATEEEPIADVTSETEPEAQPKPEPEQCSCEVEEKPEVSAAETVSADTSAVETDKPEEQHTEEVEPEYEPETRGSGSGFKGGFITGLIVGIALGAMAVFMFVMLTANDAALQDDDADYPVYTESVE